MTHSAPSKPTAINWIEIVTLGVIWGGSFMSVRIALDGFTPFWIAAGRIVLAAVALYAISLAMGVRLPSLRANRKIWVHALGMAFFSNALPFTLIAWAQQHVLSSFVGISMALVPLFTLALAHVFLVGERLTPPRIAGFALGLCGVVVLIGLDGLMDPGGDLTPLARAVCILATLSYAIGSIFTRRCPPVDPVAFSTIAVVLAAILILPVAFAVEGMPNLAPSWSAMGALAYLGLMPTAAATLLMVHVIRTAGPTFLTQTNYHVPVWSVIFGTVLLSEPLPAQFLAALALILTGLAVSRVNFTRRAPPPAP